MKEYNFAPQAWNSVFAVPGDVVDKYIKLAGAAQLKVLLWLLRNNSQDFSAKDIAASLSMQTPDVRDCIEFWVEAGLLYKNTSNHQQAAADDTSSFTQPTVITTAEKEKSSADNSQSEQKTAPRPISRAPRPDSLYVAQRINTDPQLASLMQEAQVILGRPLSHGDSSVLLMLHDNDGLPVDELSLVSIFFTQRGSE